MKHDSNILAYAHYRRSSAVLLFEVLFILGSGISMDFLSSTVHAVLGFDASI